MRVEVWFESVGTELHGKHVCTVIWRMYWTCILVGIPYPHVWFDINAVSKKTAPICYSLSYRVSEGILSRAHEFKMLKNTELRRFCKALQTSTGHPPLHPLPRLLMLVRSPCKSCPQILRAPVQKLVTNLYDNPKNSCWNWGPNQMRLSSKTTCALILWKKNTRKLDSTLLNPT